MSPIAKICSIANRRSFFVIIVLEGVCVCLVCECQESKTGVFPIRRNPIRRILKSTSHVFAQGANAVSKTFRCILGMLRRLRITEYVIDLLLLLHTTKCLYCTVAAMGRTRKGPHRFRTCRFTLVRDATLKKVDSNTRKIHS